MIPAEGTGKPKVQVMRKTQELDGAWQDQLNTLHRRKRDTGTVLPWEEGGEGLAGFEDFVQDDDGDDDPDTEDKTAAAKKAKKAGKPGKGQTDRIYMCGQWTEPQS